MNVKQNILILIVHFAVAFSTQAQTTHLVTNTTNAGVGSLRQAVINAAANDIVRLDPSLIASGSDTITLTAEIAFSKPLIFKGLYNSTDTLYISGNNTNRIFNITNTGNITIDSLVLVNGNSNSHGGAIYMRDSDSLFVTNATIRNNSATSIGGGVYSFSFSFSSSVTVNNSTISNNSSNSAGGGVYSYSSPVTVNNSTISNNSANDGGGIYTSSSVTVNNSTISNNSAGNDGGGSILMLILFILLL